jgi:NAD(P)H-quinone oxidoreductase subunit 4
MIIGVMASAGIPGMSGFISEFVVFRSSFEVFPVQTLLSMLGTALTAVYFLLLVNRAFFGRLEPENANLPGWHGAIAFRQLLAAVGGGVWGTTQLVESLE